MKLMELMLAPFKQHWTKYTINILLKYSALNHIGVQNRRLQYDEDSSSRKKFVDSLPKEVYIKSGP